MTPRQIDKMTIPEITVLLEGSKKSMTDEEMQEEAERWHKMTPRQKLEDYVRKHG